ncbi:MAG: L-threonylcarbamoyladenylate synthase [Nitrospirota bacterium]
MKREKRIIKLDPSGVNSEVLDRIAGVIKKGGVIIYPTDTFYGIGCNAFDIEAINKIYRIKKRNKKKPILILVPDKEDIIPLTEDICPLTYKIIEKFWPGPITIIFKASKRLPHILTAGTGHIGIRVPDNLLTQTILKNAGVPLTATSANISGKGGASRVEEIISSLGDKVDLIVDGGNRTREEPSTIVNGTADNIHLVREGKIKREDIKRLVNYSANTEQGFQRLYTL